MTAMRPEPSIRPAPLAASMAAMSDAEAAPTSFELKRLGPLSRSARAWTTPADVPLISVRAEPSIRPEPLAASTAAMSAAVAAPVRTMSTLAAPPSAASACSTWAAVPVIDRPTEPCNTPLPLNVSMDAISAAEAAPDSVTSKFAGSASSTPRAWSTWAADPLIAVIREPSTGAEPLMDAMAVMSVAAASPVSVAVKRAGSVSRSVSA